MYNRYPDLGERKLTSRLRRRSVYGFLRTLHSANGELPYCEHPGTPDQSTRGNSRPRSAARNEWKTLNIDGLHQVFTLSTFVVIRRIGSGPRGLRHNYT
jgi:hypothetical protein